MRDYVSQTKVLLAPNRAIEAKFDTADWTELGYLTDQLEPIEDHPRLLRSLGWVDEDYPDCVFVVLPRIIGGDNERLNIVEEFVSLQERVVRLRRQSDEPVVSPLSPGGDSPD